MKVVISKNKLVVYFNEKPSKEEIVQAKEVKAEIRAEARIDKILDYLRENKEALITMKDIKEHTGFAKAGLLKEIPVLIANNTVKRSGKGVSGQPFLYSIGENNAF